MSEPKEIGSHDESKSNQEVNIIESVIEFTRGKKINKIQ